MGKTVISSSVEKYCILRQRVNYLEDNNLLVAGEFVDNPLFESFNKIVVDSDEAYARKLYMG